jgi:hypothetical protein
MSWALPWDMGETSWDLRASFNKRMEALSSLFVCWNSPWKPVFVIRTVPCIDCYLPTYLPPILPALELSTGIILIQLIQA